MADYTINGITPQEFGAVASNYNDKQEARQRARENSRRSFNFDDVKFKADIFVTDFAPEEIFVKAENGCLVVECKHDKKEKYGIVSREFITRYHLPDDCQPPHVKWSFSASRGKLRVLIVYATKKVLNNAKKEEEEVMPEAHAAANKNEVVSTDAADKKEEVVLVVNDGVKKEKSPPTSRAVEEEEKEVPEAQATVSGDNVGPIGHAVVMFEDLLVTMEIKDQENDDLLPSQ